MITGGDYTPIDDRFDFIAGQEYHDIILEYHKDHVVEDMETLTIYLETPLPSLTTVVVEPNSATVYIVDETGNVKRRAHVTLTLPVTLTRMLAQSRREKPQFLPVKVFSTELCP